MKSIKISILLTFFLSSISVLHAQVPADFGFVEGENYKKDVVYKTVDGKPVIMDVFYPNADMLQKENPWVVFVHGGGWAGGVKENIFRDSFLGTLKTLLASGVVCATIDYRLARKPVTSYESVVDCKDAARFLLQNADAFKLDKEQYGIWGGSAGGHLSLVTALAPDAPFPGDPSLADIHPKYKFVTSFFPFTSCLNPDIRPNSIFENGKLFNRLLGGTLEEKPELARLMSPTEFLDENSLPILLVHGEKDTTLPIINSLYMMEVAKEKNADVQLLAVKNAGHSMSGKNISPSFEGIAERCSSFMLSHLGETN